MFLKEIRTEGVASKITLCFFSSFFCLLFLFALGPSVRQHRSSEVIHVAGRLPGYGVIERSSSCGLFDAVHGVAGPCLGGASAVRSLVQAHKLFATKVGAEDHYIGFSLIGDTVVLLAGHAADQIKQGRSLPHGSKVGVWRPRWRVTGSARAEVARWNSRAMAIGNVFIIFLKK